MVSRGLVKIRLTAIFMSIQTQRKKEGNVARGAGVNIKILVLARINRRTII